MANNNEIKGQINWNAWAWPFLFLILLIIEDQAFGTFFTSLLYGLLLIAFGILYSIRYRLIHAAILGCTAGFTLWHYILAAHYDEVVSMMQMTGINFESAARENPFSMVYWFLNLLVFLVLLPVTGPVLIKTFRLEKSAKQLFRLAAQPVTSSDKGFTPRPFNAGISNFSKEQVTGLAQYLSGKMIACPYFSEKGVFMAFSMGKSPVKIKDPSEVSYVSFEYSGNISVHIASADYTRFRNQLTFDRLCESMGKVFLRFMEDYANNQEGRIPATLKSF